jgi:tetratricopeptide (TPR) repeat protein
MVAMATLDTTSQATLGSDGRTLNGRLPIWKATLPLVRGQPVFGTGIGSWQWLVLKHKPLNVPTHPEYTHNDYLNLLSDYGAVGFAIMGWVFAGFFRHALKLSAARSPSEERSFAVGAVVGVTAILVHSFLDFNLHIQANAFLLALVMGSTVAMDDPDQAFPRAALDQGKRAALGIGLVIVAGLLGWQLARSAMAAYQTRLGNDAKYADFAEPEIAQDYYEKAIDWDPRFPTPHWKLGDTYRSQAKWMVGADKKDERRELAEQARDAYDEALRLNPYLTDVLLRAARADELLGDDQAALKKYLRAVELEPNSSVNHRDLAMFYRDRDQDELALEQYTLAASLNFVGDQAIVDEMSELKEKLRLKKEAAPKR